ncbi:MAG: HDIG domain-containing metalloprotein [Deltaproteobacteria bacterium]
MSSFFTEGEAAGLLEAVRDAARKKKVLLYLVGGILRDIIVGRRKRNPDIDFAMASGAVAFARSVARLLGAGFVALDEEHGTGRVVKRLGETVYTLDFSDFKGGTIEEDLSRRDFTVNSLGARFDQVMEGGALEKLLIDPLDGRKDIKARLVRVAGPRALDDDPLRVMRAFSTAALLGFAIEPGTLRLASRKRQLLRSVSGERVRDELFKIFSARDSGATVALLDRSGVLETVFPEIVAMKRMRQGACHHLDVWGHTLETLRRLESAERLLVRVAGVREYLDAQLSSGRSRSQLLKLAALLHDIGKPKTYRRAGGKVMFYGHDREGAFICAGIAQRIRLSKEEERFLKRVVALHLRPGFLSTVPKVTEKALFRFFRDAQEEAGSVLILALADLRATRGYLVVEESRGRQERLIKRLLKEFLRRRECPAPARLVTGDDLIKAGLEPGPLFGRILGALDELQAEKKIRSKEEGVRHALKMARKER